MEVVTIERVLILGGGFAGIAAARRLRDLLDDVEVVLVDKATHFAMGFRKTAAIIGRDPLEDGLRPLAALERFGVRVVNAEITAIDAGARSAQTTEGSFEADAMLVALGAETVPAAIPGLAEHGINVYSHHGVGVAAQAVQEMTTGRLVIGIFGAPYKCPPAPFEMALLLRDRLPRAVQLEVFTPLSGSLPVLGKAGCETVEGRLAGQWIDFRRDTKATAVEPGRVLVENGEPVSFDTLFAIPPHRVPAVATDAGLAEAGGWIKADKHTLRTSFDRVWAAGDCVALPMASGQPMPKSGAFAEGEGLVAAEQIAATLRGLNSNAAFWGDGSCFLEVGDGEAMVVRGRFLAEPAPEVELTTPSKEHLEEKHRFERERLEAWFGAA